MLRCLGSFTLCLACGGVFAFGQQGVAPAANAVHDSDHDGLPDELEQRLLERFAPSLMVSVTDCAGVPAKFEAKQASPTVAAKDGSIYGQVFPLGPHRVEIHYYTLWDRDCGRQSHPLDVEHVAAMVELDGPEATALYWYAGAHENTLCDISSGTRAGSIGAEHHGPRVWSSAGKHALYFSQEKCNSGSGCGADSCADDVGLTRHDEVINLGERNAPATDSAWVTSAKWPLAEKMGSDFTPAVMRILETAPDGVHTVHGRSTYRGTVQVSGAVLDSAENGAGHTGKALGTADAHTSKSLRTATHATGRSLRRAWDAVFRRQPHTE